LDGLKTVERSKAGRSEKRERRMSVKEKRRREGSRPQPASRPSFLSSGLQEHLLEPNFEPKPKVYPELPSHPTFRSNELILSSTEDEGDARQQILNSFFRPVPSPSFLLLIRHNFAGRDWSCRRGEWIERLAFVEKKRVGTGWRLVSAF